MRKEYCEARANDSWQPRRTGGQQRGAGEAKQACTAAQEL